jgi:hypothetical protein
MGALPEVSSRLSGDRTRYVSGAHWVWAQERFLGIHSRERAREVKATCSSLDEVALGNKKCVFLGEKVHQWLRLKVCR